MRVVVVKVSQRDIRDGVCGNEARCALALAMRRVLSKDCNIKVSANKYRIWHASGRDWIMELPPKAITFIRRFDKSLKVRAVSLELPFPDEALKVEREVSADNPHREAT